MQAIIRLGSHQYEVAPGKTITVEKIDAPLGSEIRFKDILYLSDGKSIQAGSDVKGIVIGVVTDQKRAPKINVFKKKRRKGYRRSMGHRQSLTTIEIKSIEA